MQPSKYQQAILDWLKNGLGHGCCNAVAGSGKSTTLRLAALALQESSLKPSEIKVIVFGKANSQDLIAKFGNAWKDSISTLHSAGFSLIKQELGIKNSRDAKVTSSKYKFIAQDLDYLGKRGTTGTLKRERAIAKDEDYLKLLDLMRLTNQEPLPDAINQIAAHYEIEGVFKPYEIACSISHCLSIGEKKAKNKEFDFTDQIWLPVKWNLSERKWFKPYKFVLVDECQDLNAAQLELSLMLVGEVGRLLYVGDPRQAIMGFAGADNQSYPKIVERTKATELPLSICYRCPKSHIDLVRSQFPEIPLEPAPNAKEGNIRQISEKDLDQHLVIGDMVLCRKTAPLVTLCIKLIGKGIKATVKGRDIGNTIKRDLEDISKLPGFDYTEFPNFSRQYKQLKVERYVGLDNEEQLIEQLNDKLEALLTIYKARTEAIHISQLNDYIDSLFSDETSPITLSTCHRAKGLEGERIFIIKPEDMPMTWRNQLDWQLEQEENLLYVALTRSKSELFVVGAPDWLKQPEEPVGNEDKTVNDLQLGKQWVNLGLITLDAGTQSRRQISQQTIDDYALQMRSDLWQWEREPLPVIFKDDDGNYYPGDGHHRIMAAGLSEKEQIYCEVQSGTLRDAQWYSTSANKYHGLPRTNADKRNQVELILKDADWQAMSDRAIAEHCGVSAPFVGKIRAELAESGTVNISTERVDKKGRKLKTENIGTKPKSSERQQDLRTPPQASLSTTAASTPAPTTANYTSKHGTLTSQPLLIKEKILDLVKGLSLDELSDIVIALDEIASEMRKKEYRENFYGSDD